MKRIKRNRNNSKVLTTAMVLVAVGMFIGFAFLSKTLNIGGTIGVNRADWNVKFRNIQVENGSVEAAAPTLSQDETTITITPTLDKLGDYYEFTVEVYNEAGIDAMLQAVPANPLSTEQQKLLEWSVTYDDGIALTAHDKLNAKGSDTLRVRVAYKTEVNEEDLANAGNMPISFTITYVQADSTSHEREFVSIDVPGLVAKANASSATYAEVSDDKKKEMFAFDHVTPTETTDYRYIGNTPNNYITFNGEEWRIIGVFDGKIKLIRNQGIDSDAGMPWDSKASGLGSSESEYGSNDWSDAQLMYLLNRQYVDSLLKTNYTKSGDLIKDANGNVIYCLGYRPNSQANGQSSYSGSTITTWTGLTDTAKNQVAEVTWNLGGITVIGLSLDDYYSRERDTYVYSGRSTTWTGRIGLMYPSDYGYTFGKGVDSCISNLSNCNSNPTSSWLYISNKYQWTLSPFASNEGDVMFVSMNGKVGSGVGADWSNAIVRPVVFLKSNIRLTGNGTIGNPYQIVED